MALSHSKIHRESSWTCFNNFQHNNFTECISDVFFKQISTHGSHTGCKIVNIENEETTAWYMHFWGPKRLVIAAVCGASNGFKVSNPSFWGKVRWFGGGWPSPKSRTLIVEDEISDLSCRSNPLIPHFDVKLALVPWNIIKSSYIFTHMFDESWDELATLFWGAHLIWQHAWMKLNWILSPRLCLKSPPASLAPLGSYVGGCAIYFVFCLLGLFSSPASLLSSYVPPHHKS